MNRSNSYYRSIRAFTFLSIALLTVASARAATHVVKFGGSAGIKYVPASFTAAVGDTVAWEGDFTVHPLSSTTIPAGSASWHVTTGTRSVYVIAKQGVFNYKCDLHTDMTGSFQAGTTGNATQRRGEAPSDMTPTLASAEPGNLSIRFTAPLAGSAALRIIDLNGREIGTMMPRVVQRGTHVIQLTDPAMHGVFLILFTFNGKKTSLIHADAH